MVKVDIKAIAVYAGSTIAQNGNVTLKLKLGYDELINTIQMTQMLNNDVTVAVKIPDKKAFKTGTWRIKTINIAGDGEATVTFTSLSDFVEMDNLNRLIAKEKFGIRMQSEIELESEDDNG